MNEPQANDPLHGVSLKKMLEDLVERRGWEELASRIRVRCFSENPSLESSLKFLRKTGWARMKVEQLYLEDLQAAERNRKRNRRRAAMRAFRAEQEAAAASPEGTPGPAASTDDTPQANHDDAVEAADE